MTATDTETPEAWVGCLGCYNAGALVGQWIDGADAEDVTIETLHGGDNQGGVSKADILRCDPYADSHEELWVMDFQGYGDALTGECSPAEAARVARSLGAAEDAGLPREAFAAWIGNGGDIDSPESAAEEYCGEWPSEEAYAQDLADEIGAIDESAGWPSSCIDWTKATRELFMDYWSADAPGGVYVFRS